MDGVWGDGSWSAFVCCECGEEGEMEIGGEKGWICEREREKEGGGEERERERERAENDTYNHRLIHFTSSMIATALHHLFPCGLRTPLTLGSAGRSDPKLKSSFSP